MYACQLFSRENQNIKKFKLRIDDRMIKLIKKIFRVKTKRSPQFVKIEMSKIAHAHNRPNNLYEK